MYTKTQNVDDIRFFSFQKINKFRSKPQNFNTHREMIIVITETRTRALQNEIPE